MKKIVLQKEAFNHIGEWMNENPKVVKIIWQLIKEIQRTPFAGKGNPEPLKHEFSGYWSRRIINEHRLIYKLNGSEIIIVSCKGHY